MKAENVDRHFGNLWKKTEEVLNYEDLKALMMRSNKDMKILSMEIGYFFKLEDHTLKITKKQQQLTTTAKHQICKSSKKESEHVL